MDKIPEKDERNACRPKSVDNLNLLAKANEMDTL